MARLAFAIVTTLLEELLIIALVLVGLPAIGVHVPVSVLYALIAGWLAISVIIYRLGTIALQKKIAAGLPSLDGCDGVAMTPLAPEGMVRVNGETWTARSAAGMIKRGEAIEVVGQDEMKLLVRRCQPGKEPVVEKSSKLARTGTSWVDEGDDQ